jgi:hypothetical protein
LLEVTASINNREDSIMFRKIMMKNIIKDYKNVLIFGIISIGIGLLVGAIDALFGRILLTITQALQKDLA